MKNVLFALATMGALVVADAGKTYYHEPIIQTQNSIPTDYALGLVLPEDSICTLPLRMQASDHFGNVSVWDISLPVWRVGSGPIIVSQAPLTKARRSSSHAAQLWMALPVVVNDDLAVQLVGQEGPPVDWYVVMDEPFCMVGPYPAPSPSPTPSPEPSPSPSPE